MQQTLILGNIIKRSPLPKRLLSETACLPISATRRLQSSLPDLMRRFWITAKNTSIPAFWNPIPTVILQGNAPSDRRILHRADSPPTTKDIVRSSRLLLNKTPIESYTWPRDGPKTIKRSPRLIWMRSVPTSR